MDTSSDLSSLPFMGISLKAELGDTDLFSSITPSCTDLTSDPQLKHAYLMQQIKIAQLEEQLKQAHAEIGRLQQQIQMYEEEKLRGDRKSQSRYWTAEEHQRFLEALEKFGVKDVKAISAYVSTRNPTQVRTHAQKYYLRLERERMKKENPGSELITDDSIKSRSLSCPTSPSSSPAMLPIRKKRASIDMSAEIEAGAYAPFKQTVLSCLSGWSGDEFDSFIKGLYAFSTEGDLQTKLQLLVEHYVPGHTLNEVKECYNLLEKCRVESSPLGIGTIPEEPIDSYVSLTPGSTPPQQSTTPPTIRKTKTRARASSQPIGRSYDGSMFGFPFANNMSGMSNMSNMNSGSSNGSQAHAQQPPTPPTTINLPSNMSTGNINGNSNGNSNAQNGMSMQGVPVSNYGGSNQPMMQQYQPLTAASVPAFRTLPNGTLHPVSLMSVMANSGGMAAQPVFSAMRWPGNDQNMVGTSVFNPAMMQGMQSMMSDTPHYIQIPGGQWNQPNYGDASVHALTPSLANITLLPNGTVSANQPNSLYTHQETMHQ